MSVAFNGTTSKLEHTTQSGLNLSAFTIVVWALANGQGEGAFGRIVTANENGDGWVLYHNNAANEINFLHNWTTTLGLWKFTATDAQWNGIAVSYNTGSTANDPVARVNYASATVTETSTPVGTLTSPSTGYCIGNRTGQDRTWDGRLAHLQIFNRVLSAAEMDSALVRPGSIQSGLIHWFPLWTVTYTHDVVGGSVPTATSLLSGASSPPAQNLWSGLSGYRGIPAAVAAPAGQPITKRYSGVPFMRRGGTTFGQGWLGQ